MTAFIVILVILAVILVLFTKGLNTIAGGLGGFNRWLRAKTNSPDAAPGVWKPRRYSLRTQIIAGIVIGVAVGAIAIILFG